MLYVVTIENIIMKVQLESPKSQFPKTLNRLIAVAAFCAKYKNLMICISWYSTQIDVYHGLQVSELHECLV